jgi:hypothetical protein
MLDFGMEHGLRVRYLYHDDDILEVEVSAFNGRFAGSTALYIGRDELSLSANALRSFPNSRSDERDLTWGAFGPESAGGALRLHFRCVDSALHVQVSAQIEDSEGTQSAVMLAVVEPAAIDSFIPELRRIERELGGDAILAFSQ